MTQNDLYEFPYTFPKGDPVTYYNGAVSVSATPTKLCNVGYENDGVLVQNTGAQTAYLGGPNVAASGANLGISIAAGAIMSVPTVGGGGSDLYATTASSTTTLVYLYPSVS